MTDFRALCAELLDELDAETGYTRNDGTRITHPTVAEARAALAQPEPEGHQAIAKRAIESCLAQREEVLAAFIAKHGFQPEDAIQVEQRQPDGTSTWRIERRSGLGLEVATDEKLILAAIDAGFVYLGDGGLFNSYIEGCDIKSYVLSFAYAVLARWGRPAVEPVPVSERLPGPEDCTTNPRTGQGQWCWGWVQHDDPPYSGRWRMMRREWLASEAMAWLPHHALPMPQQEAQP